MKNSEKTQLKYEVIELSKKGYSKKEGIKTLVEWGYCYSTARGYWDVFALHMEDTKVGLDEEEEMKK